jgi:cell division protein FtsB
MGDLVGLAAVFFIFGPAVVIPVTAMVLKHRKEMAQLERERHAAANQEVLAQIEELRREIAELRRTTTEYDMSLQANLENLQERVRALEAERESHSTIRSL